MTTQLDYTKKPSVTTLRAALRRAVAGGSNFIQLTWGENQITVHRTAYGWDGHGWIGRTGGNDLAREIYTRKG